MKKEKKEEEWGVAMIGKIIFSLIGAFIITLFMKAFDWTFYIFFFMILLVASDRIKIYRKQQ